MAPYVPVGALTEEERETIGAVWAQVRSTTEQAGLQEPWMKFFKITFYGGLHAYANRGNIVEGVQVAPVERKDAEICKQWSLPASMRFF